MTTHSLQADSAKPATTPFSGRIIRIVRGFFRLGPAFYLPSLWLMIVVFCAFFANLLPIADPLYQDLLNMEAPPTSEHLFGTDNLGRDILSRAIHGSRISLTVGLIAPFIAMMIGTTMGVCAGYFRGRFEMAVVMYADTSLAFPGIVLLLLMVTYLGASLFNITVALGILFVPGYARVSRANTLTFAQREFVTAAKALGASHTRILVTQILPNVLLPILAYSLIIIALMIVLEGVLSFLGLGVPAPAPSWGLMIQDGRELLETAPHAAFIPAGVMFLTVLSFNMVGDTLRKRMDSREAKF